MAAATGILLWTEEFLLDDLQRNASSLLTPTLRHTVGRFLRLSRCALVCSKKRWRMQHFLVLIEAGKGNAEWCVF